jgi:hypothetical protein
MSKKYSEECRGGEDCREERHLCRIAARGDHERLRELIRDAKYFCRKCGRSARDASNLCRPTNL